MKKDSLGAKEMSRREESMRVSTSTKSGSKNSRYPKEKKNNSGFGQHVRPNAAKY